MPAHDSFQTFASSSPTVPNFSSVPQQPRPQLSTFDASAHPPAQQARREDATVPSYDALHHAMLGGDLTASEKEKADYYSDEGHWADASPHGPDGRKGPPAALTILQPPKAVFASAPNTPSSPRALAFGDESASIRTKHVANKSMDWSRFSVLVKEKERKGEKSSEWLERKQSIWRKYHKLGWLAAVVVIAAVAGALAWHFTHLRDQVEPEALTLGGFNGGLESSAQRDLASTFSASTSHVFPNAVTTPPAASTRTQATSPSSAAAASPSAETEEAEIVPATPPRAATTTQTTNRAAATTSTTMINTRAAISTSAVSSSPSAVRSSSSSSTSSSTARSSTSTAESRLKKRFFNPVHIDYQPVDAEEQVVKRSAAAWETKKEASRKIKRSAGGWEDTESIFADMEDEEVLEKRSWREIEWSRPAPVAAGVRRHLQYRGHRRV